MIGSFFFLCFFCARAVGVTTVLCLQSSKMAASQKTWESLSSFFFFSSPTTIKTSASSEPSESVQPVCDSTRSTEAGEPQKGSVSAEKKVPTQGKNVQTDWLMKYPWLEIRDDDGTKNLFCALCTKACEKKFTKILR